jgi:GrpB-like predicted nucleotidyltransferase (UPF0157 family)
MKNLSSDHQHEENAPIEVVPYDSSWPEKFAAEREVLEEILKPWIVGGIEHVGSTAVPGLDAKPVIDIMVGVESLESSRDAIPAAGKAGYIYWPYKADLMHWFCKPSAAHRTHHLHLIPFKSRLWKARLGFRNALRQDAALAAAYAELKYELAGKYRHDREAYTQSKGSFVKQVLESIDLGDAPRT